MLTRISHERLAVYLETLERPREAALCEIGRKARRDGVPVIRPDTESVLRTLLEIRKPETILEIGTAVGYSSVFFCLNSGARITTIENYPKRIAEAADHFSRLGLTDRIELLRGDAEALLPGLSGPYDLIFLDAAQGQYIHFLPELLRLMRSGSLLIADNVLIGGDIVESHYAVERRKRTIHKRMREYLREVMGRRELVTSVLPVGDGLAVTVKR